jgi:flagellar basal-body rod protein FlgB
MDRIFFEDNGMRFLERSLDLSAHRQVLISGNLANVDTPGYRTIDLNFEQELKNATDAQAPLATSNPAHVSLAGTAAQASAEQVEGLPLRNDLNNVNIDREMAQLSTNALKFSLASQLLAGKFRTLKSAITEGR